MASEAAEMLEHMEHAGHAGGLGRMIGLTMAALGILLAVSSAMVSGSRTEMIAKKVEQTGVFLRSQAVSKKYRMIEANLVQLHSLLPDPKVMKSSNDEIASLEARLPKEAVAKNRIKSLQIRQILNTVTPTHEDMLSFVKLLRKLRSQADAATEWSESYNAALEAYAEAAEHYERAQLCAELGIVLCSVALLLANRPAWLLAIVLGLMGLFIDGRTLISVGHELSHTNAVISTAEKHYLALGSDDRAADEELCNQVEHEDHSPIGP